MIDYALDNRMFVLADGRDLLAHIGESEAPAWRFALSAPAVAIGQTPKHVVAALADGAVLWFDRGTGAVAGQMHAGLALVAGASNRAGGVVALAADGRLLGVNTGPAPMAVVCVMRGGNRVALAGDGRALIATPGWLTELDRAGRVISQARSSPVNALAWHREGVWFVAGGRSVDQYQAGRVSPLVELSGDQSAAHLAAGPAGVGVAGGAYFSLFNPDRPGTALLGVTYIERLITGISFGPQPWIALALAGGDANKIDCITGATHRSDTHPGRPHNKWMLAIRRAGQK